MPEGRLGTPEPGIPHLPGLLSTHVSGKLPAQLEPATPVLEFLNQ